ncbi:hypothetical protein KSF_078120 [Reticulibacter mediterranei]|uniref:non-specific serine/threonine protein kinase n=1 Tax=Reticulibacter mediterranei TaxID=2778369 RepID=A0A8J3N484_9CHLR|nr:protein kinase [Reticulibacter mediterranei]GHO97764.1 hypothetical protein KSF_078120 [Reticulibacter mediterranei]
MILAGQQLDRYHIVRPIGSGGMGDVYLAQDPYIRRQVAIKVIRIEEGLSRDALNEATRLFEREVRAIVSLDHPHILSLFDYGEQLIGDMKIVYLVMPYRPEGSLARWLRSRSQQGLLAPQDVAHMIQQAAEALQHAHERQIIHQDVKPSNFLLRERKETPTRPDLLLTDFSIARLSSATSDASQSVRGTPTYMAPEQWQGRPVFATDQYALGIMAYELLSGRPPFQGSPHQMMYQHLMEQPVSPSQVNPRLSQEVDAVLLRALSKQPQERFPSILAFAEALQRAFDVPTGDLQASLAITPEEAAHGSTRTITLPAGRTLTVTIPPGVQDRHLILLAGEGERKPVSGQRGNVLLTVTVQQANKPLSDEEKMMRTVQVQQGERENKPPVVPANNSNSGGIERISPPPLDETLVPTPGVKVHPGWSGNSPTPIPPPPPDYRPAGDKPLPPPSKQRLIRIVLGVAALLSLLLSFVVGTGAYQDNIRLNTLQAAPTLTASARQRATRVANQAVTATARAEAYPSYLPGQGTPILFDALHQPGFWASETYESGSCQFISGAYHVREAAAMTFNSCAGAFSFSNFAFEVEATIIQGDCSGVLFRSDRINRKYYKFQFCLDGSFSLFKYVDRIGKNAQQLVPVQKHIAIKRGANETNMMAVVAQGNQITLFVNQQQVAMVQDGSYAAGSIELVAASDKNPTEVSFQNIKIWTL